MTVLTRADLSKLTTLERMRVKMLEERLGVPITKYTVDEWLAKAIESDNIAKSGDPQIVPEWWFQTMLDQIKAAELAEKLAQ